MNVLDALALALMIAGIAAPLVAILSGQRARSGVGMMMELWMAGSLLRLRGTPSWDAVFSAALLLALRLLVVRELGRR